MTSLTLFVQYPNHEPVLREVRHLSSVAELRAALEVLDDQHLHLQQNGKCSQVEMVEQLFDGAFLKVSVPRRRIFVTYEGRTRPVVWYPGATPEQIESTVVKACGLPVSCSVELQEGDTTVVISPTIPNDTKLRVVPLGLKNGSRHDRSERNASPRNESPRRDVLTSRRVPASTSAPARICDKSRHQRCGSPHWSACQDHRCHRRCSWQCQCRLSQATQPDTARSGDSTHGTGPVRGQSREGGGAGQQFRTMQLAGDLQAQPAKASAPEEHCVHILAGHNGFVQCLCTDCNIMIWDLNNLQYIGTLPGHRGFVKCMAATLSRKLLCSGSQDEWGVGNLERQHWGQLPLVGVGFDRIGHCRAGTLHPLLPLLWQPKEVQALHSKGQEGHRSSCCS
eukprot:g10547.t1